MKTKEKKVRVKKTQNHKREKKRVKKTQNHKREQIKVKKYFQNNLKPGDFVMFPSGQRYKILLCGTAKPVCKISNCKKQAQGLYNTFSNLIIT